MKPRPTCFSSFYSHSEEESENCNSHTHTHPTINHIPTHQTGPHSPFIQRPGERLPVLTAATMRASVRTEHPSLLLLMNPDKEM